MRARTLAVLGMLPSLGVLSLVSSASAQAGQYVVCYSAPDQSPIYLSSDFHIDVAKGPAPHSGVSDGGASDRALNGLKAEWLTWLRGDRGYKNSSAYPAYCDGEISVEVLAKRRETLHTRFPQQTFVETGWKPGMVAHSAPAPAPAPPPAPSAYEKAVAAQRPASNQAPAPMNDDGRTYSWCWVLGHPPHAPSEAARSVYYVSGIFPATEGAKFATDFESAVRTAHPNEQVRGATCNSTQPMTPAQTARDKEIEARKKSPYQTVSEVNWKP